MSEENSTEPRRVYRKRRRAEHEEETRLRITQAAVDLHGTVGPARTTISAVAQRAGVQRGTVYRHFPDDDTLFQACSSHWMAQHPLPDLAAWMAVEEPGARVRTALTEMYAWYAAGEQMLEKTTRDVDLVPALRPSMEAFAAWFGSAADAIQGGAEGVLHTARARAVILHALSFATWRSLVRERRLPTVEAIDLMTQLVRLAADAPAMVSRSGDAAQEADAGG